ncbi:MAG: hypothetical protein J3R72DRAFT_499884 [Linnemannia gamsii]|nr:MAG: hypothetical protein J3R72DRAFT_499884 [Linnemannia gamsii]
MPKHHPIELKGRIIGAHETGATPSSIAKAHNLSINTVLNIIKKWKQEGTVVPKKSPGRRRILGEQDVEQLLNKVKDNNRATLQEIAKMSPKPVSESTALPICQYLEDEDVEDEDDSTPIPIPMFVDARDTVAGLKEQIFRFFTSDQITLKTLLQVLLS